MNIHIRTETHVTFIQISICVVKVSAIVSARCDRHVWQQQLCEIHFFGDGIQPKASDETRH